MNFNENYHRAANSEQQKIIDTVMQNENFKILLKNRFNKYLTHHAALLEVCKRIEDTFSPFMLIKIFFNRMYIMMDILCVLYVRITPNFRVILTQSILLECQHDVFRSNSSCWLLCLYAIGVFHNFRTNHTN